MILSGVTLALPNRKLQCILPDASTVSKCARVTELMDFLLHGLEALRVVTLVYTNALQPGQIISPLNPPLNDVFRKRKVPIGFQST